MHSKTFVMFQGEAQAALDLYTSTIPGASVEIFERHGPGESQTGGSIKRATLHLPGQDVMVFDSPVKHAFNFTASISFFLDCDDEAQLDRLHAKLSEGGNVFMPPDNYGFSRKFTWIADRFGVSWQLNLPAPR